MAEAKENFGGVFSRDEKGRIVVNLKDLQADRGFVIEGLGDRPVIFREPVTGQNAPQATIPSSPTAGAFNPANAVVKAGQVQLNKVSRFLADLPDTAKAELLVAPQDTANIFGRGLGTFNEDTASIRNIGESHGIHVDGQALTGMRIFDRPDNAEGVTYEEVWAKEVRSAWEQANESGETVTTGLAIGTIQIVHGRERGIRDVTVTNNLYSNVANINAALKAQGGQEIITSKSFGYALWQLTSTENPDYRLGVSIVNFSVDFSGGGSARVRKDFVPASSRAVALQIAPAP